ncbi:hypothetical protein HP397_00820 [Streptobacillus felis]|uniref:Uncharacterized protein n=1 Tax=Streptobacillus felis TaxID=1384509 RepID=A0A7Z0TBH5_9FUSO|nr:hypothetical protein [Streptobacillus felis]
MKVNKHILLLIAGILWLIAGSSVLKIGITTEIRWTPILVALSLIIFYIFNKNIFSKLVVKHTHRIMSYKEEKKELYLFFDKSSYIIMFFMMTLGISLRKLNLAPLYFIKFFYTGLGSALFLAGVRFIKNYFVNKIK